MGLTIAMVELWRFTMKQIKIRDTEKIDLLQGYHLQININRSKILLLLARFNIPIILFFLQI